MNYITNEEYTNNVMARCSDQFHVDRVHGVLLCAIMAEFRDRADNLDQFKKLMFYGKMHPELESLIHTSQAMRPECALGTIGTAGINGEHLHNLFTKEHIQLLHAILGVASEAGELCQAFINAMASIQKGEQSIEDAFDNINIREEFGDVLWYVSLGLRSIGSNLGECMTVNDRKLEARYGKVFSVDKANNRDLDAERKELED